MNIKILDWDSAFFDLRIGFVMIDEYFVKNHQNILADAKTNFDLIYGFCNNGEFDNLSDIKNYYQTTNIDFTRDVNHHKTDIAPEIKSQYRPEDIESIYKLSLAAGHSSRFKIDPRFNESDHQRLYKIWVERSLNHQIADEVFLYAGAESIMGFVTIKIKDLSAEIGLIAVAETQRGLGIGTKLISAVNQYALSHHCKQINVATQLENSYACKFYENCDFKSINQTKIYHFWL